MHNSMATASIKIIEIPRGGEGNDAATEGRGASGRAVSDRDDRRESVVCTRATANERAGTLGRLPTPTGSSKQEGSGRPKTHVHPYCMIQFGDKPFMSPLVDLQQDLGH